MAAPLISVVIATYNRSETLRCAVRSALLQTIRHIEVWVIGDACTDDSEAVVRSFGDPRLKWYNRPTNSGGQSAPNNDGIARAAGLYVAYLGHDDLWYPTHLAGLLQAIERNGADLAGAVTLMYGPPESGVRGLSGLVPPGADAADWFFVPSSIMHRTSLVDEIGPWSDPATITRPADVDFLRRATAGGARIAASMDVTVFKFNAAWRRDSYVTRGAREQEAMLALVESGRDFRRAELIATLGAVLAGRFVAMPMAEPDEAAPGEISRAMRRFKGVEPLSAAVERLDQVRRFPVPEAFGGLEWHEPEWSEQHGAFRWTGPATTSTIALPVSAPAGSSVAVHIIGAGDDDILTSLETRMNGSPVPCAFAATPAGTVLVTAVVPERAARPADRPLDLALVVARTVSPAAIGTSDDARSIGVAVNWVELTPPQPPAAPPQPPAALPQPAAVPPEAAP